MLADIEQHGGVEELWCLGDMVDYGSDHTRCLELLQQYKHVCVAGNHDLAALGKIDTSYFNPDAAEANGWTAERLTVEDREYLGNLPLVVSRDEFTLVHGSPRDSIQEYILSTGIAGENFAFFQSQLCLVGHSHVPCVFQLDEETGICSLVKVSSSIGLNLGKNRLIINPGGVGQPRDGNPRASYVIYDSEAGIVGFHRVNYDIEATQDKMIRGGLPTSLVTRLSYGI